LAVGQHNAMWVDGWGWASAPALGYVGGCLVSPVSVSGHGPSASQRLAANDCLPLTFAKSNRNFN